MRLNYTPWNAAPLAHDGVKFCTGCETEKPLSDFNKDSSSKDGYKRKCAECNRAKYQEWADRNRDKTRGYSKKHGGAHREEINEYHRKLYWIKRNEYLAANPIEPRPEKTDDKWCPKCKSWLPFSAFNVDNIQPDKLTNSCRSCRDQWFANWYANPENAQRDRENWKKYYQDNLEIEQQKDRDYYRNNPEKMKQKSKDQYAKADKEVLRIKHREYCRNNPHIVRPSYQANSANRAAAKLRNGGSFTKKEWVDLCEKYDYRCLCCGRDDVNLTVDHVIPLSKGGGSGIENLEPLCKSCNSSKKNNHTDYRPDSPNYYLRADIEN